MLNSNAIIVIGSNYDAFPVWYLLCLHDCVTFSVTSETCKRCSANEQNIGVHTAGPRWLFNYFVLTNNVVDRVFLSRHRHTDLAWRYCSYTTSQTWTMNWRIPAVIWKHTSLFSGIQHAATDHPQQGETRAFFCCRRETVMCVQRAACKTAQAKFIPPL